MRVKPLNDLYINRKKAESGELPEYFLDYLSKSVKTRLSMILRDFVDYQCSHNPPLSFKDLIRNYEYISSKKLNINYFNEFEIYLDNLSEDYFFNFLEYFLMFEMEYLSRITPCYQSNVSKDISQLIKDINKIFLIEKIGFEIIKSNGLDVPYIVFPVNSEYLHKETIKKPRELMWNSNFEEELSNFDKALDNYRTGNYDQTCIYAGKAYEGTIKKVCKLKNIDYNENKDKIPVLILKLKEDGLIHQKLENEFNDIYSALDKGPNNVRNIVAHPSSEKIPEKMEKTYAEFCLRSAGNHIVFLIEAYESNK
ncbi:hypothetical protein [Methanococcus maripaludis]|uniref:HEPN domain-containing protein n=1 Tax=Methanococcus maripaludis TaxID=39152 RepID=A0A7J9PTT3_METMI|nr:hypothetical protein [Methanococcus maripaludis]MBA2868951.1 HEPN domain-containing protein [Methanococcus maripaludis]